MIDKPLGRVLTRLSNRLDKLAIDQLRLEVVKLNARVEELEEKVDRLEYESGMWAQDADIWRDHALQLSAACDQIELGLTKEGQLLVLQKEEHINESNV